MSVSRQLLGGRERSTRKQAWYALLVRRSQSTFTHGDCGVAYPWTISLLNEIHALVEGGQRHPLY